MVAAARMAKSWWQKHPLVGWGVVVGLTATILAGALLAAFGATTVLYPSGRYAGASWTLAGGGTWAGSLDNFTDGQYALSQTNNDVLWMDIDPIVVGDIGFINSVDFAYRTNRESGGGIVGIDSGVRVGSTGTPEWNPAAETIDSNGTPITYTWNRTRQPDGITPWTAAAVDALQGGVQRTSGTAGVDLYIQGMSVTLDYDAIIANSTLTVANPAGPGPAFVLRGATPVVDTFTMQRAGGTGTTRVQSVTITNSGTTPNTTVTAVRVYRDAGTVGVLDGADVLLNTVNANFSAGGTAQVVFNTPETVTTTLSRYLVVYVFSGSAADGATASCLINEMATNFATVTGVPAAATGGTFTVDVNNPSAAVSSPSINHQYTTPSPGTISGTATDSVPGSLSSVGVSIRRSGDNLYWNGTSGTWGAQVFNAATTSDGWANWSYDWTFNPATQSGTPTYTIFARATDAVAHTGDSPSVTGVTISNASTVVTIGDGTNPAGAQVSPGQTGIAVDAFTLSRAGALLSTVSAITVTNTGTTPSSTISAVDIYRDDGDGTYDAGDTKLNTTSATFSGATARVVLTAAEAVDGTADTYFVVYTVAAGAADNATANANAGVAVGDYANIDTLTDSDPAGNTFTVKIATTVEIGAGPVIAAGDISLNQTFAADAFTLDQTVGSKLSTVSAITVTNTGTTPSSTISAVDIYRDDGDGTYDAGDTKLNTTSATFSGATARVVLTAAEAVDGTADTYFVVYTVAAGAADNATANANAGVAVGDYANIDTLTDSDPAGNTFTVRSTTVVLGDGANDPASDVWAGQMAVAVDQFTLQRTQGSKLASVETVTVTKTGTAAISNVYIYSDSGTLGVIDGTDVVIASGTFGGGSTATLTINQPVTDLASYLVVYDIPGSATDGQWTAAEITNATHTNVDTFTENDNEGFQFTVRDTNVTLGDGANDPAAAGVTAGRTTVPVDQFTLQRTQGAKAATVSTVTVTKTGTIAVTAVRIYSDGGTLGVIDGADASIATGTFSGSTATLAINQAVTNALAPYLVVYDIPAGAALGQTITAEITAATRTNIDNFTESDNVGNTFTVVADGTPPSNPTNVGDAPGVSAYTIARLWWDASTDNIGVAGYRIYRATADAGPFVAIGTSATARAIGDPWLDTNGVAGQDYWYKVSAYDAVGNESAQVLATPNPVRATWSVVPHDTYAGTTRLCRMCHAPHVAATGAKIFRDTGETLTTEASGEMPVCYACHDGTGASTNIKTGPTNSFVAGSGHELEALDTGSDLTNTCAGCHGPHRDVDDAGLLPKATINSVPVAAADNTWCLACHDAANTWYGAGYPAPAAPSRDATGYPVAGTFPGPATYNSATANAHMAIPATAATGREAGDCLYCHASHRGASAYDGLVAEFKPPSVTNPALGTYDDYAAACFVCHGSVNTYAFATPPRDIQQFITSGGERAGHRIETSGGTYPVGAPLPCYECHNPHGSTRGNATLFADTLGQNLTTGGANDTERAQNIRRFCFVCHTATGDDSVTPDNVAYSWDTTTSAYVQVPAGSKIAGLGRDAAIGANRLRLPAATGHYRDDTQSCATCHGSEYSTGGLNVHNPSGGSSNGGIPCYQCHGTYQTSMEDNAGARTGATRAASVHHVMGRQLAPVTEGDYTPESNPPVGAPAYPTFGADSDVFCVSCHTDHNNFNSNKGANLRADINNTSGSATANTDFQNSGAYGICVSCHDVALAKQGMGSDQLDVGAATTPVIAGADYAGKAHDYTISSYFGLSAFNANCSKCHTDEQNKEFQSNTSPEFGTHWSASAGILRALGTFTDSTPQAEACFKCHITAAGSGTDLKTVGGKDVYNAGGANMSVASEATYAEFQLASRHDLAKVQCANCHNVHEASAANPAADPDNTYNVASLGTRQGVNTYCLKCHDGVAPAQTVSAGTLVPYTVTAAGTANVSTYYATSGHGTPEPGAPFVGRAGTGYATAFAEGPSTLAWTNGSLSTGAPDAATAVSPTGNVFDGRQSFTMPTGATTITSATLTVRSRAAGNWGLVTSPGGTVYKNATAAPQNLVGTAGGVYTSLAAADNTRWTVQENATTRRASAEFNSWQSYNEASVARISSLVVEAEGYNNNNAGESAWVRFWDYSTGNWSTTWHQLGTTNWPLGTTDAVRNTAAITSAATIADYFDASGAFRLQFADNDQRLTTNDGTQSTWGLDLLRLRIDYSPIQNDDTWAIQYATDGSTWVSFPGSPSSAAEIGLTDHPVGGLNLTGILTPANFATFRVRILGAAVNGADGVGTIQWDSSTLALTYSGTDPGLVKTSCRDCHEQHGSSLVHLLGTQIDGQAVPEYADTRDQAQCLACHRSGTTTGAPNIAQYYPGTGGAQPAYGEAIQSVGLPGTANATRFGHRTKTVGTLAAGSAVPCGSCHNPHGANSGGYMLAVTTQINSTTDQVIGFGANQLRMSATDQETAANVRNFCLTCHITSDATGQGWNGSALVNITSGKVLGIDRTGGVLKLPAFSTIKGHLASESAYSCYLCHGDDFTQADSVNVHNPASGESRGGIPCYTCHTVYRDEMEDGLGAEVGDRRAMSYHHVLGSADHDGDYAQGVGASAWYPVPLTDTAQKVYCLSCHVDHDLFSPWVTGTNQRARNLRTAFDADTTPAPAASDFNATSGGVCLGCHSAQLDRDNVNQKAESASTKTPAVGSAAYDASAHQYVATSTFADASTFSGDCVKCHDSAIDGGGMEKGTKTSGFQTSNNKFSVHSATNRRILEAMGVIAGDPPGEEDTCYQCHSVTTNGFKLTANRDWYNAQNMDAASQSIYGMTTSAYGHLVGDYDGLHRPSPSDETQGYLSTAGNKHVECADCHNVHASQATLHVRPTNTIGAASPIVGVNGVDATYTANSNWANPTGYPTVASSTKEYQICFKCHSGANTAYATWGGTGAQAWTNVALDFNPNNSSYHPVVSALPANDPSLSYGSSDLAAGDMRGAGTIAVNGVTWTVGGWGNGQTMYCSDCHASGNTPAAMGPHGSSVKWMLRGPNQAWPYETKAMNGSNNSTITNFRDFGSVGTNLDNANGDGLFCRNCHNIAGKVHTTTDKHGVPCVTCHIRVPHGGKSGRLIAAAGTAYSNLPARLTMDGQGGLVGTIYIVDFNKASAKEGDPNSNCNTNTGCSDHGTTSNPDPTW